MILVDNGSEKYFLFGERKQSDLKIGGAIESIGSGFIEPNNSPKEQLISEIKEESGIGYDDIFSIEHLHIGWIRDASTVKYQDICCDYLVRVKDVNENEIVLTEHTSAIIVEYENLLDFVDENLSNLTYRTIFTLEKYIRDCYE